MIYAVNYANDVFKKAQKLNIRTAYQHGVDKVFAFSQEDIDKEFYEKNKLILDAPRGNGYWLWKPYFINLVLEKMNEGDCLVYSDAGLYFQNDVRSFFAELKKNNWDMICQSTGYYEFQYTKRDTFVNMHMDTPEYSSTMQRNAIVAMIKSKKTCQLVKEWLHYACDPRCITDMPNTCGKDNYDGFVDHRHDQSIFSLLSKKYEIPVGLIFEDFSKRKTSRAILCYHHSIYGNKYSIAFHRKADPHWWRIKGYIKKMLRINAR